MGLIEIAVDDSEDTTDSLPPNWTRGTDPSTGHQYYYNTVTKESSWEVPTPEAGAVSTETETVEDRTEASPSNKGQEDVQDSGGSSSIVAVSEVTEPAEAAPLSVTTNDAAVASATGKNESVTTESAATASDAASPATSPSKTMSIREMRAQFFSSKGSSKE